MIWTTLCDPATGKAITDPTTYVGPVINTNGRVMSHTRKVGDVPNCEAPKVHKCEVCKNAQGTGWVA